MTRAQMERELAADYFQLPREQLRVGIIALHHHVIEYPRVAKVLSERIGTALVNGNWFARRLQALSARAY
jgi:hypothetical protein